MAEQGAIYRDKASHLDARYPEGRTPAVPVSEKEADKTKYEKVTLLTKLRDILRGIKQGGLGSLTKIE